MREVVIRLCAGVNNNYSVVADCTRVAAGVVVIEPTSPVLISDSASSSPVVFCKIPAPADLAANSVGVTYTISFTTSHTIPASGKVKGTFPSAITVGDTTAASNSCQASAGF